jgi:quercetin 2,3-dioxygenase
MGRWSGRGGGSPRSRVSDVTMGHAEDVSNLDRNPQAVELGPPTAVAHTEDAPAAGANAPAPSANAPAAGATMNTVGVVDVVEARKAAIGDGTEVRRLLPQRVLRTIGAWCFLDHYGPDDVSAGQGMRVPPHPHIGLQTASWLFGGTVLHRDSLGHEQLIRPGELNLMTSGRGIVHSEESPKTRPATLHGVQLWIALPDTQRHRAPDFAHHADLPVVRYGDARVTIIVGEFAGQRSPATTYTPLIALEVMLAEGADDAADDPADEAANGAAGGGDVARDAWLPAELPLDPAFEHGVLAVEGPGTVGGAPIAPGLLAHLPQGTTSVRLDGARFFIIGGKPLRERLVMWWNFVARTGAEIEQARGDWMAGRFGEVSGYDGDPLAAPPLPATPLKPR